MVSDRPTTSRVRPTTTPVPRPIASSSGTTVRSITEEAEENIFDSSGDVTCDFLYNYLRDGNFPDFPAGSPPPLSPDEDVLQELCNHIRQTFREFCADGVITDQELCGALDDTDTAMTDRLRRHKSVYDDDEDLRNIMSDDVKSHGDGNEHSDLLFDDLEKPAGAISKYKVEIDSVRRPNAVALSNMASCGLSSNKYFSFLIVSLVYAVLVWNV